MNSDANWPKSSSRLSCSERDLIWIIVSTAWRETVIWKKKQPDRFSWISKLKVSELIANEFVNEMSCEHEQFFYRWKLREVRYDIGSNRPSFE